MSMPCARSRRRRSATSGSCTAIMPPSPVVMTLRGCSEKQASGPSEPICAALVAGADRARRVLDERQAVALGELQEGVHVGRQADLVDRHDRLRARRDRALGGGRIEVVGARVDVREDRLRAAVPDGVGGRDERQRRHDHLVAGADAGDVQRELSAVVQLVVATASAAPTRAANACSKARTRGPGRPSRTRSPRRPRPPRRRRRSGARTGPPSRRRRERRRGRRPARCSARHHSHQAPQALFEADLGLEAQALASQRRVGQAPRNLVDRALGAVFDRDVRAHHLDQQARELQQARLGAAGDVEDLVGAPARRRRAGSRGRRRRCR